MIFLFEEGKFVSLLSEGRQLMVPKDCIGEAIHYLWLIDNCTDDAEKLDQIQSSRIDSGFKNYLLANLADSDTGYESYLKLSSDHGYPVANFRIGSLMEIDRGSVSAKSKELILSAAQQGHIKSRYWVAQDLLNSELRPEVELGQRWMSQCRRLGLNEANESKNVEDQRDFFE